VDDATPLDILVIEDDADTRANLRDILELDGHRVESAGTAAEALARGDWPRYAAIILDRRLPDATADQLLPRLKASAPEAAVIVVTGYSDIQGAIAALRLGASDYILKPLDPEALRASLGRVSERRRLALAKERSDAAFRHLVEAAECMIVILRPDHSILYFSPFAERLTGYPAAEVLGLDYVTRFLPPADRKATADEVVRVLSGRSTHGIESPVVCRDGSLRSMVWNARPLADYEGGTAVMKVGQDITSLKQAQQRALQAERLSAIGEVVAGLAHESRNALQRSQACLEMLGLADRDRPESLELIARVQKAQDHLHHLYEDVRGYAAPIVLDRCPCDVREVWREAWAQLEPARRGRQVSLREEVVGADTHCLADPFRLGQVFRNILENALAAGQGPVEVTIRYEPPGTGPNPTLRVSVRDNGPGLNPDEKRRVFDPFFTTKAKGTGLGMAIARRVVEAHGGQISVGGDTDDQPGAVFVINLPRGTL
jgi:PAS domain S-box-containing protein